MTLEKNIIEDFDKKYKNTGVIGNILLKRFFSTILSLVPQNIKSVAEIGCGVGYSTAKLRKNLNPEIYFFASDIDPVLVELTKEKNPGINAHAESIYELKHADNSYDLVICMEVLEHLEDPRKALKELARITKEYAILSVPREPIWRILNMARGKYWKYFGNTFGHLNHWSTRAFKKFVSQEFEIVEVKPSLPWTIILARKKK